MSSTREPQPKHGIFPQQDQLNGPTAEEKALSLSLRRLGFDPRPGHSAKGEALRWASIKGFLEQVQLLLRSGPNDEALRDTSEDGRTAAHHAAFYNRPDVLRALLEAGTDVSLGDRDGFTPLYLSAIMGHCEVVELLLANGSDPSWVDSKGFTASFGAACMNRCDVLQVLAAAGDDLGRVHANGESILHAAADDRALEAFEMLVTTRAQRLSWRNIRGGTPLHRAIASTTEMVKQVLVVAAGQQFQDTSFDIDSLTFDSDGSTPLHVAASRGKREVVELLLDYGANVHITNLMERSALHIAAEVGHSEIVRALVRRGADVNSRHRGDRSYAILDAVHSGHMKTCSALLEGGALLTAVTADEGYTALHIAAGKGHFRLLRLLLQHTSLLDINALSYTGFTPLFVATMAGKADAVRLFLQYGANPSVPDSDGLRPLHRAVAGNHLHIVDLLLGHGESPAAQSFDGESALSIARRTLAGQDLEEMEVLVRAAEAKPARGPNKLALRQLLSAAKSGNLSLITTLVQDQKLGTDAADEDGYTSLLTASENGRDDAVRLLISMGADVHAKNAAGESSIWLASRYGHEAVVRSLLQSGADVDSADELDQTAISAAIEGRHSRVVESLLVKGADLRIRTNYGKTAQMFAVDSGCDTIVNALMVHSSEHSPEAPVDQLGASALMPGDGIERDMGIVNGENGATCFGLTSNFESSHLTQTARAVSDATIDISYAIHNVTHGNDVHRSDDDCAREISAKDLFFKMASEGMNAAVNRLIRAGFVPDEKDPRRSLALVLAASKGNLSVVRTLLDHGFDPNLQDGQGRTALFWAANGGWSEVAQVLMDFGGNCGTVEGGSTSPLLVAVARGHLKVLDLLLRAGNNKELNGNEGFSALKIGITLGHVKVVKHLIESGVNVEPKFSSEETPLTLAVRGGNAKLVHLLLQAGAVMRTLAANRSLLCVAAFAGYEDVAKILLEHHADADHLSEGGKTPLIFAAFSGHEMVVRLLIEMGGAKLNHRDSSNMTAQSYAKMRGHEGVAALLRHSSQLSQNAVAVSSLSKQYAYAPLSGPSCIRVFDLHPGLEHENISFDIYEVDMSSGPSYEALSYEWKDELHLLSVNCNGCSFLINPNLKLALQNIRSREETRTLWVDAICINQRDVNERSSQVAIMANIYRQAKAVLMWLGRESPEIEEAIATIPAILSTWAQFSASDIFDSMLSTDDEGRDRLKAVFSKVFTAANQGVPPSSHAEGGISDLLDRSYFTRAWIYQEMFLAGARGLVLCGRLCFSWGDFGRFICVLTQAQVARRYLRGTHNFVRAAETMSKIFTTSLHGTISQVLDMGSALGTMSHLNCGDPRDKVFAALGTVDPSWTAELVPDYRLSVKQVYINTARAVVRKQGLLFWRNTHYPLTNKILGLPSWVPDWTSIGARYLETDDGAVLPSLFRRPSRRHIFPSLVSSHYETTDTTLFADGYVIGEVAFSVTMTAGEDIYDTIIRPLIGLLATLDKGIFDHYPYTGTFSYLSVFCRFLNNLLPNFGVSMGFEKPEASPDLTKPHEAYLTRKIMADPNTPEASRKVTPELEPALQKYASQIQVDGTQFSQEDLQVCLEMEERLLDILNSCTEYSSNRPHNNCDLYCTRSGYLGVTGEGIAERGLLLVLLEGFGSVAVMRKKQDDIEDERYEFVEGADIFELDWRSYRTLEDLPMNGELKRLKIV